MFGSLLLVGCTLLGQVDATADDDVRLTVRRLVRQLNAPQLAQREAAEEGLLKLGPKVLGLLPPISDRTPPEVELRLGRIRQKLQRAAAEGVAGPSLITLAGEALPLSKIREAIEKQSGNKIIDFRPEFKHPVTDPLLKVDFDKTPFWQALDQVLDRAELSVYSFGPQRAIHLIGRSETSLPRTAGACYCGPLRVEAVAVSARRVLRETDGRSMHLQLEVAWEPRIKPISLKHPMGEVHAVDENGNRLAVENSRAELEPDLGKATFVKLALPFRPPPRSVQQIARLKGRLNVIIPGRVETFRFGDLLNARKVEKRIASATVILDEVRRNEAVWEVCMRVRFDEAHQALESHRGWFLQNEAYLEGPDGKVFPVGAPTRTHQTDNEVGLDYGFRLKAPPTGYQFVYNTPGVIVAKGFDYEIEGVRLP